MSHRPRLDLVAPPFAGHLFPLLDLARSLRTRGLTGLRVLSTHSAGEAVQRCGLEMVELLGHHEDTVLAIANPQHRVGSNPFHLLRQFRTNLSLMGQLRDQLQGLWTANRPDIVLADFTIPVAGLLAQSLDITWWTGMPSPCALETGDGPPSYLGGCLPRSGLLGRVRDALGWGVIRLFKRGVGVLFARELRALSIPGVYRRDGSEMAYSPECILGFGMREFEFERSWPASFHWIGPLTASPPFPHSPPEIAKGKRNILLSLGTHLFWARDRAAHLIEQVASRMPDCVFHFSLGKPGSSERQMRGNVQVYGYFPYDEYLKCFDAAIIHGGTGITYSCIKAGVPILVWPQDYDQFDHAARIVVGGLGLRLRPRVDHVVASLRQLLSDASIRERVQEFQTLARGYDAPQAVWELLASFCLVGHGGTGAVKPVPELLL
jgi:UDP:flavonoid glycosyltransferase YjiC (YdhE family)